MVTPASDPGSHTTGKSLKILEDNLILQQVRGPDGYSRIDMWSKQQEKQFEQRVT